MGNDNIFILNPELQLNHLELKILVVVKARQSCIRPLRFSWELCFFSVHIVELSTSVCVLLLLH